MELIVIPVLISGTFLDPFAYGITILFRPYIVISSKIVKILSWDIISY